LLLSAKAQFRYATETTYISPTVRTASGHIIPG